MDVAELLRELGLEQYTSAFLDNAIDAEVLGELTADDLKDLGVNLVGHRRKLLAAIAALQPGAPTAGQPIAATEVARPAGTETAERRQLTVMFCDLVGATAVSTQVDPEDLRDLINAYHSCCAERVTRFGGYIAKYMGDGILAYFGYPQAHEDDPARAIHAGLAVLGEIPNLVSNAGITPQVRIGIATGMVVVGDLIGEGGAARESNVVGETPNLAARLQSLADPGTLVIADATQRLAGRLFEYRDLGQVKLKGFSGGLQAWQVTRTGTAENRFDAQHGEDLSPIVGRAEELELLLRRWEQAKSGEGRVVLLSGEPGIGKSRLVRSIQDHLAAEPLVRLRYFCSPHHVDSALYPFIGQLERAAGFERDDSAPAKFEKLAALLTATEVPGEDIALLADLLSIAAGIGRQTLDYTPQRKKELTLRALLRQLEVLARQRPVLLVFEDAHWIDPTSRELLDRALEQVRGLPVLLLITHRPEFHPPWIGQPHVTVMALSRLGPRDGVAMIEQIVAGKAIPLELLEQIVDRTDGVPLFVEELTKTMLESGLLREEADRYVLDSTAATITMPATLEASLIARLDRLSAVKEVAQTAAAMGREFSHSLIEAVSDLPNAALRHGLDQLVEAGLVFRRGEMPEATYTFKHALVQDAAYGSLLRRRRQALHQTIAQVLEAQFPENATAEPELLARHYTEAGLTECAVEKWEAAGQKALMRGTQHEAAAHFREAVRLIKALPKNVDRQKREIELLLLLGHTLFGSLSGGAAETEAAYTQAQQLARALGDADLFCRSAFGMTQCYLVSGRFNEIINPSTEALIFAEQQGSSVSLAVANRMMGQTAYYHGRLIEADRYLRKSVEIFDQGGRNQITGFAHNPYVAALTDLALLIWIAGRPDDALGFANIEAISSCRGSSARCDDFMQSAVAGDVGGEDRSEFAFYWRDPHA